MKGKRYTEEQIIATLNQHESGVSVESICRDMGIAQGTFYRWRSKYGGMRTDNLTR
jgi:putative transposase